MTATTLTPRPKQHGGHGLGLRPDLPDVRDLMYRPTVSRKALPAEVRLDQSTSMPGPYDQGQLGSCTGNGIAGAIEFDLRAQGLPAFTPSRLFIYFNERYMEGTVSQDAGASIRDGVKSVNVIGAPAERYWPYKIERFADEPPKIAFTKAGGTKLVKYERVPVSAPNFQQALAAGRPVVFGVTLYDSFPEGLGGDGMVPTPTGANSVIGGHCMVIVGYAMLGGVLYFRVRNSWGKRWADKGYCWMPAAYLGSSKFVSDCWVLTSVS